METKKRTAINKIPLLAVLGPTASHKSNIAGELANHLNGEIINADSRQIYKFCSIGTSSPSALLIRSIPHHLYNFLEPDLRYSAAEYAKIAFKKINCINENGKLSIVVGGSGLYIKALLEGLFNAPGQNVHVRSALKEIAMLMGPDFLHTQLQTIDPPSAHKILKNDLFRIIRAIEIFYLTGKSKSHLIKEQQPHKIFKILKIGIEIQKAELCQKIEERVDAMISCGLIEEVQFLTEHYNPCCPILNSIGYKELIPYLQGFISLAEAICIIKRNTKRYAKRQLTWFKKDKTIIWKSPEECLAPSFIDFIKNSLLD